MEKTTEINAENFHLYRDQILAIERASFRTPWGEAAFLGELSNSFSRIWVHERQSKVDAYLCFWRVLDEVHLLNLAVEPSERRKGIAGTLLSRMLDVCAADGGSTVWLEVRPSNTPAIHLYLKSGFRVIGRRPRYYSDTGEDALIMCLNLAPKDGLMETESNVAGAVGTGLNRSHQGFIFDFT